MSSNINPFNYGRPIDDPERFIGHRRESEQVYSRLLSACESTSIVGERRTGKTSLLKILGHPGTLAEFGISPDKYIFIYQDFQFLDENTVPTRFWQRVLRAIGRTVKSYEDIVDEINQAINAETIDNYTLDDIFTLIDDEGLSIIFLLDEFENVTRNKHFDNDFFGGLRALAIHHNLALVTSSRHDLVELTHSDTLRSSPFFNIFAAVNLRPFSETETMELIDRYLAGQGVKFLLSELNVIFALAGYHPYFLQMACHHLFSAYSQELDDSARRRYVVDQFRHESASLFQDYWQNSKPSEQILLTVMALRELEGGLSTSADSGGTSTSRSRGLDPTGEQTLAELEGFYVRAGQVVNDLDRRNLVVKNPEQPAYHLFSTELADWIADEIIGSVDDLRAWRNWQKEETLVGALPANLQEMLAQVVGGLNPAYRDTLGNWLLEPTTANAALHLVDTFVGRYEQYKSTRPQRDAAVTMANAHAPVGDTPKGIFASLEQSTSGKPRGVFDMVSQRLEGKQPAEPAKPAKPDRGKEIDSLTKQLRDEQIYGLKKQLVDQVRNLNRLREEAATYGSIGSAPLKLQNDIADLEALVTKLEEELDELEQPGQV